MAVVSSRNMNHRGFAVNERRARLEYGGLVREARAVYDSIFPPDDASSEQVDAKTPLHQG